jgi:hypothetical protein
MFSDDLIAFRVSRVLIDYVRFAATDSAAAAAPIRPIDHLNDRFSTISFSPLALF